MKVSEVKTFMVSSETDRDLVKEVNRFLFDYKDVYTFKSVDIKPLFKSGYPNESAWAWYACVWYDINE